MASRPRRPVPVSRRERPAKPALSREAIVAAALAVIAEDGVERLTLRRLASVLDTGAASLYVYFESTDLLYAAVLDELLGRLDVQRGDEPWRERLVALLVSYIELLFVYPVLARTALVTRPSGAHSLDLWELMLSLLDEGGIVRRDAAWSADLLLQHATATAAEHGTRSREAGTAAEDLRIAEAIDGISQATHPHVAAAAAELLRGTPSERLAWGFEVLIDGVVSAARTRRATRPAQSNSSPPRASRPS
jgi:AcrR family transcriptional regulator